MSTVTGYLSGVSPSMLAFIVFGTTKTFQRKMYRTFVPRSLRKRIGRRGGCGIDDADDLMARPRPVSHMPASTAASSRARASIAATVVGSGTPQRTLSHSSSMPSVRKPERAAHLGPIYEPGCMWLDEDDDDSELGVDHHRRRLRRSQIGLAVTSSPQPPASPTSPGATFLREEGDTPSPDLPGIPLSRFNSHGRPRGNSAAAAAAVAIGGHVRAASTTIVWSEGRRGSESGFQDGRGGVRYYAGGGGGVVPPRRGSSAV